MMKVNSQKLKIASNRLNADRWTANRVIALVLCASMALSSLTSLMVPTRATDGSNSPGSRALYIREADENTMDSYVQASLGGYIYTERKNGVDAVTTPTVRNNYGTRYAGEVWSDLSVFAQGQKVIAEIRPFEVDHDYTKMVGSGDSARPEYERALDTLNGVTAWPIGGFADAAALKTYLAAGKTLTAAQASALNKAANDRANVGGYSYSGDGDFDGMTLQLGEHTDGLVAKINMNKDADFLNVFSLLGSSEIVNDNVILPLDVVFVLDTSTSMATLSSGADFRLSKSVAALNSAFATVMENNKLNRVALLTFDTNVETWLELGRYEPISNRENRWVGGFNLKGDYYEWPDRSTISDFYDQLVANNLDTFYGIKSAEDLNGLYIDPFAYPNVFDFKNYPIIFPGAVNDPKKEYKTSYDGIYFVYNQIATYRTEKKDNTVTDDPEKGKKNDFELDTGLQSSMKSLLRHYNFSKQHESYTHSNQFFQLNMQTENYDNIAEADREQYTSWVSQHSGTNTHQGLYDGLNMLFKNREKTATVKTMFGDKTVPRVPVVVFLSDGGPTFTTTTDMSDYADRHEVKNEYTGKIQGWAEPKNPAFQQYDSHFKEVTNYERRYGLIGEPSGGGWGNAVPALLMAAHMKAKVAKAYEDSFVNMDADAKALFPGVQIITVAIDTGSLGDDERDLMKTVLDPEGRLDQKYIEDPSILDPAIKNTIQTERIYETLLLYFGMTETDKDKKDEYINEYKRRKVKNVDSTYDSDNNGYNEYDADGKVVGSGKSETPALINRKLKMDSKNSYSFLVSDPNAGNIKWDDLYYNDAFYDSKVDTLGTDLLKSINSLRYEGTIFAPISGSNAAGVEDSLTYSNPIGRYMTVDSVTDIVMFGEHYQLVKDAVYDYKVNEAILKDGHRDPSNNDLILEGWYKESGTNPDGSAHYEYRPDAPSDDPWGDGWTYRITYKKAQQLVPTLEESGSDEKKLEPKQQNTTYTGYRIGWEYKNGVWTPVVNDPESNDVLRANTSYNIQNDAFYKVKDSAGNEVGTVEGGIYKDTNGKIKGVFKGAVVTDPKDKNRLIAIIDENAQDGDRVKDLDGNDLGIIAGKTVVNDAGEVVGNISGSLKNAPAVTFNLLKDIKIWVEDTGRYQDENPDFVVEAGYSEALFVDIKSNVLPTQVARIDLDPDVFTPIRYKTNLDNKAASTPLRIFYGTRLDPDYLRYNSEDKGAQKRDNAIGVAMAAIDSGYLKKNTGTNFTVFGKPSNNRYTAFYSSYYSNTSYKDYPVMADDTKTSRGNPLVSFSPGPENQFYRFQKNRVLFLIPGSYGLEERPAEIDLTPYLEKILKERGEEVDRDAYYKDLLEALNEARTDTPYAKFGECRPVDGGDDILVSDLQTKYQQNGGSLTDKQWTSFVGNLKKARDDKKLKNDKYQPQISSENWYYIIREFYYPMVFEKDDQGNQVAYKVQVCYMAIARKGNEFGSGVAGGVKTMGSEIEWYHPDPLLGDDGKPLPNTAPFDGSEDHYHYGYPDDDKITPGVDDTHTHDGGWYVSAKPGGLRVGGLANFAGVKGYDIREGVSEGKFEKVDSTIAKSNVTVTAKTFFLPTISSAKSGVTNASDVVVNIYLGNNGRILVEETLLLVTKLVQHTEYADGKIQLTEDLKSEEYFEYAVYIDDSTFVDERFAGIVVWDKKAKTWRRIVGSIDAITNNDGLLYMEGSLTKLARVDADGTLNEDGAYYIYVEGTTNSRPLYDYGESLGAKNEKQNGKETEIEFSAKVKLIPVDGTGAEESIWLPIATMDPNAGGNGSEIDLSSDYNISYNYLAKGVEFDSTTVKIDNVDYHKGTFTLRSGEGLLFNGISNGAEYIVVEKLTDTQAGAGWQFLSLNDETRTGKNKTGNVYEFDKNNQTYTYDDGAYTYTVSGMTGTSEETAHYINISPEAHIELSGVKEVFAPAGTDLAEGQFTFELTAVSNNAPMPDKTETSAPGTDDAVTAVPCTAEFSFDQITFKQEGTYEYMIKENPGGDNYIYDGREYQVTVTVKRIRDLNNPPNEKESEILDGLNKWADENGMNLALMKEYLIAYVSKAELINGGAGGAEEVDEVKFENYHKVNLTLSKTLLDEDAEPGIEFEFTVTLEPPEGVTLDGEYDYTLTENGEKISNDGAKVTVTPVDSGSKYDVKIKDEAGERAIKLTNGQAITIHGLPYGTKYIAEETDSRDYITVVFGDAEGMLEADETEVNFINSSGGVLISKEVTGTADEQDLDRKFEFAVTLVPPAGEQLAETYNYILAEIGKEPAAGKVKVTPKADGSGGYEVKIGTDNIKLAHGQMIQIEGLPEGTKVTVTEKPVDGFKMTVTATDQGGETVGNQVENGYEVVVPKGEKTLISINFLNEYQTGDLEISKEVIGGDADDEKTYFTFTVTLGSEDRGILNGSYDYKGDVDDLDNDDLNNGKINFKGGSAIVKLKHGQHILIKGLPVGIGYKVEETEANGYTPTVPGNAEGTIRADKTPTVKFENKKDDPDSETGDLTVSKTVTGNKGDTTKEFTFTVELTVPKGGVTLEETYDYTLTGPDEASTTTGKVKVTPKGNKFEVKIIEEGEEKDIVLKHGQKITIHGLPVGIGYKVEEIKANGYTTTIPDNAEGTIRADKPAEVKFVNKKDDPDPETIDLTVSKTVTGKDADLNKLFTFTIELTVPEGGVTLEETYDYTLTGPDEASTITGKVKVTPKGNKFEVKIIEEGEEKDIVLKHGQKITIHGLPVGTIYTIKEEVNGEYHQIVTVDYEGNHTVKTDPGTIGGTLLHDTNVGFENTTTLDGIRIRKEVDGNNTDKIKKSTEFTFTVTILDKDGKPVKGTFEYTGSKTGSLTTGEDGKATVKLMHDQFILIEGIQAGYSVTVTEAEIVGFDVKVTGGTPVENGSGVTVTVPENTVEPIYIIFTNRWKTGDLTVSKTVTGNKGDTTKEFTFTVELSDKTISGKYGGMTFTNGVATFKLKHNGSVTATGLPAGITYTVTEAEANQDGYTTTVTGNTGTIPDGGTAKAAFVNDKDETPPVPSTGSLTVSKTVTGNTGERNKQFHFTVELSDRTINGTYGDVTFVNGVASFTLRHGESKTIRDLPDRVTYTVTEAEANQDGYMTTASGRNGTISKGWRNLASFVNNRDNPDIPKTGDESQFVLWMVMLGLSLTGLLINLVYIVRGSIPVGARGGKRLKDIKGKRLKR